MPRSPTPLTVASFLLQRPRLKEDPVPKKRGRKRNLVVSPPNNKSPLDPKNFPPLAKKVSRSTPENSPLPPPNQDQTPLLTSSLSPICRMSDSQSIELDEGHLLDDEEGMEFSHVSPAEAAKLLELDTESAIDKHIREEEVKLAELRAALLKARAKTQKPPNNEPNILPPSNPAPSSFSSAPPINQTAKPNKIPNLMDINVKSISSAKSNNPNLSYAAKAAKPAGPARNKEIVEEFLHIYSSRNRKIPISRTTWEQVDDHLISIMADRAEHGQSNPGARVAHSGFDLAHGCGFIACRDPTSAEWYKSRVAEISGPNGETFKAWGKADVPISRLCRIFIPDRFKKIHDARIAPIIMGLNPPMENGIISHKDITQVQGGRAVFLEVDMDTYAYIRTKHYKLDWLMGSVDCHGVVVVKPENEKEPANLPSNTTVPGVTKLPDNQAGSSSTSTLAVESSQNAPSLTRPDSVVGTPTGYFTVRTPSKLAYSPLTPVKQMKALEEEENLDGPASNSLDPRKRDSKVNTKYNKSKNRKIDSNNDSKNKKK